MVLQYFFNKYNFKNGKLNFKTLLLRGWNYYTGIEDLHIAQSFIKSSFKEIYCLEQQIFENTFKSKFRDNNNITQYLIRYFHLASGKFSNRHYSFGKMFILSNENNVIVNAINKKKYKIICINDNDDINDFNKTKNEINSVLENLFPEKSSFEK